MKIKITKFHFFFSKTLKISKVKAKNNGFFLHIIDLTLRSVLSQDKTFLVDQSKKSIPKVEQINPIPRMIKATATCSTLIFSFIMNKKNIENCF